MNFNESLELDIYIKEIINHSLLSTEEEIKLAKEIKKGNDIAKVQLILSNLKLVIYIAKKYTHKGIELVDLVQEGNLGLIKAAEKFDINFECRFSTYAVWWIRQSIIRALTNKSRNIRMPCYLMEIFNSIERARVELQKNKKEVKIEEISEHIKIPVEKINYVLNTYNKCTTISMSDSSLNNTDIDDGSLIIENTLAKEDFIEYDNKTLLNKIFNKLKEHKYISERDLNIYIMRVGFSNEFQGTKTLQEVADEYNLTRERIRQIILKIDNIIRKDEEIKKTYRLINGNETHIKNRTRIQ